MDTLLSALDIDDEAARNWYAHEAFVETWSVRTLRRNIASQYYYRLLQSQNKIVVENEMKEITAPMQKDKLEFIKNPVVAEFWDLHLILIFRVAVGRKYHYSSSEVHHGNG